VNLAELLTIPASMYPQEEILRFESEPSGISYAALQERVSRVAGALRDLGVQPGDRVAALQTNTPAVVEALYATASLGAVFVPLNYRARADELVDLLAVASPRVLLAGDRYLDEASGAAAAQSAPTQLVSLESPATDLPHLATLAERAEPLEPAEVSDDDLAVMMFTSGTTARAKAVMLAHAQLVSFVFSTTEPADGTDRGAVLLAAPLYHIAGLTAVLTATFAGRRIVLMRQFEPQTWLRLVADQRVTHAFLVPTMLKRVLDEPSFATTDLSSLEVLSYGAAPMPLSVIRRAIEAFPSTVGFVNAFGQTETTSTVTMLGPDDHRLVGSPEEVEQKLRRLGSIGRPLPDVEVQIVDQADQPLPPGQVGEIAIRTERVMRGYHGQDEATQQTLRQGWLRTRDLGWMDEEGYIFLAGRQSDLIIRGGENIAPDEVEQALESHPAVDEAAVIGIPDEEWGERVAAVVVRRPGSTVSAEELGEHVRQSLASFKKPELVVFADSLPRNAVGKLLRKELRERVASEHTS
jgi:acyl-CoA synthetase (AMP-forming)/AMP-acid ligase II